jgi:DNA-binding transcriptional LysR family regulator
MRTNWHSIREFEALRALITSGSATSAARRLGVSQSAVSRAVANLEARVGTLLFERVGNRLVPTPDGLAFDRSLDGLFDALTRIDRTHWADHEGETLRLVAPPTFAHHFLERALISFFELRPGVRINLEVISSDQLVTGIAEGRFDLGITDREINHSGVRQDPFRTSDAMVMMAPNHPLCAKAEITPRDLDNVAFVAITKRHSVRTTLDRILNEAGVVPRVVMETATVVSAHGIVRAGLGVAVLNPFPIALSGTGGVVYRPFVPRMTFRTQFLTPSTVPVSALARRFQKHVRLTTPRDAYTTPESKSST